MNLNAAIKLTPLRRITTAGGDVLHALKSTDNEFSGFGEAYFSTVDIGSIKGWKKHKRMTMNLIVPVGEVEFVFYFDKTNEFLSFIVGANRYARITVLPGVWFAFKGMSEPYSLVLNISDIPHDPDEVERCSLSDIDFSWK